jgi:hypothetical protein
LERGWNFLVFGFGILSCGFIWKAMSEFIFSSKVPKVEEAVDLTLPWKLL